MSDTTAATTTAATRRDHLVAEINGHHIYRAADGVAVNIWTPGVGFWALGLTEEYARSLCPVIESVTVGSRTSKKNT